MERHGFDVLSFLFGALFVGAGISAALFNESISSLDGRWVWPAVFIVAGVVVLVATVGGARRSRKSESEPPDAELEPALFDDGAEAVESEAATDDAGDLH